MSYIRFGTARIGEAASDIMCVYIESYRVVNNMQIFNQSRFQKAGFGGRGNSIFPFFINVLFFLIFNPENFRGKGIPQPTEYAPFLDVENYPRYLKVQLENYPRKRRYS